MWRSLFLAIGFMTMIVGIESMLIESATVYAAGEASAVDFADPNGAPSKATKVVKPGEFVPWALISGGAIIVIYAFTLPKRFPIGAGD